MNSFPDLSLTFKKTRIIDELFDNTNENTIIGYCIKNALLKKMPEPEIWKTLKEQLTDHPHSLDTTITNEKLLIEIKEVCGIGGNENDLKDLKIFEK